MIRFTLFQPPSLRGGSLSLTFLAVALFLLGGRAFGEDPARDRAARVAVALAGEAKSAEDRDRTVRAALALAETDRPPVMAPAPRVKACPCDECKCGLKSDLNKVRDCLVRVRTEKAQGSGTVIWSKDGRSVVLTAAHVVEDGTPLTVRGNGKTYPAELLGAGRAQDLAALLVAADLPAVPVCESEPAEGAEVLMVGMTSIWSRGTLGEPTRLNAQDVWTLAYDSDSGDSGAGVFHKGALIGVHCGKCGASAESVLVPSCPRAKPIRAFLAKLLNRDGPKPAPVVPPAAKPVAAPKADEFDLWLINGQFIRVPKGTRPNFSAPSCPNGRCPLQR